MSKRPITEKKKRRVIKALERTPLPAYVDLVQWIKLRNRCTTGTAHKVLLSGALEVDGMIVGVKEVDDPLHKDKKVKVLDPHIPADMAPRIKVVTPELLK